MDTRREEWIRLEVEKRKDLEDANCDEALRTSSVDDLKRYVNNLQETSDKNHRTSAGLMQKLDPTLDHVASFANALTLASQYSPVACLVWGAIQAFLEVRCYVDFSSY